MSISAKENTELTAILAALMSPATKDNLKPHEANFVQDQSERHNKWGADIFISPKQWNWLKVLYERETGDKAEDLPNDEDELDEGKDLYGSNDLDGLSDDEIPF